MKVPATPEPSFCAESDLPHIHCLLLADSLSLQQQPRQKQNLLRNRHCNSCHGTFYSCIKLFVFMLGLFGLHVARSGCYATGMVPTAGKSVLVRSIQQYRFGAHLHNSLLGRLRLEPAHIRFTKGSPSTNLLAYRFSSSDTDTVDNLLTSDLRNWRKHVSDEQQRPLYMIFNNRVLDEIVTHKPTSLGALRQLTGVGPKILANYGEKIIEIVCRHWDESSVDVAASAAAEANSQPNQFAIDPSISVKIPPATKSSKRPKKTKKESEEDAAKRREVEEAQNARKKAREELLVKELTVEQHMAAARALNGTNLFITGSAGTGKSHLLNYVINCLQDRCGEDAVAITAPTGIAAMNIGGHTIHSFAGIGLGSGDPALILEKVLKSSMALKRWKKTKVLIIDEVSMLNQSLFELLDLIARTVKASPLPFGGVQLIVVGDFLQLPPVSIGVEEKFCFQSPLWALSGLESPDGTVHLREIVRQKDPKFVDILNQVRVGKISSESLAVLNQCLVTRKALPRDNIIPTKLYCVNKDVDQENHEKLAILQGDTFEFLATDVWESSPSNAQKRKSMMDIADKTIPATIALKTGAQVMLLRNRNFSSRRNGKLLNLVNGSRGVIVGFMESFVGSGLVPVVEFDNGMEPVVIGKCDFEVNSQDGESRLVRKQIPLKLAWAMTIHKSQGTTLTRAELMIPTTFSYGQAYVALSRVTSLGGLWLTREVTHNSIKANPVVLNAFPSESAR